MRKFFIFLFVFCSVFFLRAECVRASEMEAPVVVVIDPGHGGAPGETEANGGANYHDVYEKDINLETALAMKEELTEYRGIEVYITREDDTEMSLKERAEFAKEKEADMFISIHYNASAEHLFYGSEVWVSAFGEFYAEGYGLATRFMEQFRNAGFVDRGIKTRIGDAGDDYYGVIRHCAEFGIPGIIVEHCYLDDDTEYQNVDTAEEQRLLGIRDATAVAAYYGLSKETDAEKIVRTPEIPVPEEPVLPDDTEPQNVTCVIESYDEETGSATVFVTAEEKESRILYYSYSIDGENFSRLFLRDDRESEDSMRIQVPLGKEAEGILQVRLYNNYNLKGDSEPVAYDYRKDPGTRADGKLYNLEDAYEIKLIPKEDAEAEERPDMAAGWRRTDAVDIAIVILSLLFFVFAGVFVSLLITMHWKGKNRRV